MVHSQPEYCKNSTVWKQEAYSPIARRSIRYIYNHHIWLEPEWIPQEANEFVDYLSIGEFLWEITV